MSGKRIDPLRVTLRRVRLSFADIWQAKAFGDGEGEPKFNANFLIDPDGKYGDENLDAMEAAIEHAISLQKDPKPFRKLREDKICLRDGNDYDYDGYEDMMFVSASNAKRPVILDRDKTALTEADGVVYSGCFVDAIVRVWAQDNKWGKRINASLEGIRFREDGEAFGAAPLDPDEFEDLDEDDDRPSRNRSRSRDDRDDDDRPSRGSRRSRDEDSEDGEDRPRRRGRRHEDGDDDRSSRRSRRSRDEDGDDEDRPRRRGRDEEDGDDEDRPRRRGRDVEDDDVDRPSKNSRARRSRDEDGDDGDDDRPRRRRREEV